MKLTSISIALSVLLVGALEAQTVHDVRGPTVADRGILLSRSDFSFSTVRRLAREYLEHDAKDAKIARLLMAPDEIGVTMNYGHGSPHNTYESTVADIARIGILKGPMARVLSVNGLAKISYFEDGKLTEEFLQGLGTADPTIFREGQDSFELLHFFLAVPTRTSPGANHLTLYFRATPQVSISSCIQLFKTLVALYEDKKRVHEHTF
jgi:hypothetical protein